MNAAAKVMNQSHLFQGGWSKLHVSKALGFQTALLFMVLLSALSVVYVINLHRVTCSQMQMEEQQTHQLQLQWGQLLLEQASLATPARVEALATHKLHMVSPSQRRTIALRAE
ncbi:MAG: cell division protein FtsL [Legionellaceae bacterium]|nr:cell division protein FtsL [Legionellaceae bacterium]